MKQAARGFRKEPTRSEAVLWGALRRNRLDGRGFRRQQPIGPFVVDFFCATERLVVEVDGGVHESQVEHDRARQECLEALGLRFVRIPAAVVETNLPAALRAIRRAFAVQAVPSPLVGEGWLPRSVEPGEGGRRGARRTQRGDRSLRGGHSRAEDEETRSTPAIAPAEAQEASR